MREVEAAAPGHQQFAAGRRHCVINGDRGATLRQHFGRHQPGRSGADDGDSHRQSFIPARTAACATYFWVCSNAPCNALAVDMSPMASKCAAMASGVQSAWARLIPSVSTTLITANEPAPAPIMVRVG